METLKRAPPPLESETLTESFRHDPKLAAWRKQMEIEYQKQKSKGGIIDRATEESRFLIVTETTPTSNEPTPSLVATVDTTPVVSVEASATTASKAGRGGNGRKPGHRRPDSHSAKARPTSAQQPIRTQVFGNPCSFSM